MNRTFRQCIVAIIAGASSALALAQVAATAPGTPLSTSEEEAARRYDAARAACNAQPKFARAECLRNAKDDYDRATGATTGATSGGPLGGGGTSGRASKSRS